MNTIVTPLKGIPISFSNTNFTLTQEEKNIIYQQDNYMLGDGEHTAPSSSKDLYVLNKPGLNRIKYFFEDIIKDYKENVIEITDEIYMTNSWITFNNKKHFHHKHRHPNVFLSMIYYVASESGDLQFYFKSSLQEGFYLDYTIKNYNIFNSTKWTFEVKTKDIIIFPGWVTHSTTSNLSDEKRIAIVANFFIRGKLGTAHEELYLK
jgi:uncharacterized protein (TIGR02466 family)